MKARYVFNSLILFVLVLLTACAPAATPTTIASEPKAASRTSAPSVTYAPAATQAPAAVAPQAPAPRQPAQPTSVAAAPMQPPSGNWSYPGPDLPANGDNTFQDYGVNPAIDTHRDHLSTFGLDVDTASYSVTRRYIREGQLPPFDAVRVEEFVNSFDQGYAAPADAAFSIYADGAGSPFDPEQSTYILRFGVQGYRVPDSARKPAYLTFVIDTSGSMSMENRLGTVKSALSMLVRKLNSRDHVAIVAYGSEARLVLEPTRGNDRLRLDWAINQLTTGGSTNAEDGLRLGYQAAMEMYGEGVTNRVILCSDGVANTGVTTAEGILRLAEDYVAQGITLTTIGVGMGNFNDVLLEQLADKGNGEYFYIDTLAEAHRIFVENLTSTLQVIARDAKVQVDFNPDVVRTYRLLGYENRAIADQDFRNNAVDAGEIGAGHAATALYAVALNPGAQGRIATVQLRWQDADTNAVREINGNFNTWDLAGRFEDACPRYRLAVTVAQFAEVLRQSPYAYGLSLNYLAQQAYQLASEMPEDEQVSEFAELVQQAGYLHW